MPHSMTARVQVLGFPIDRLTLDTARAYCMKACSAPGPARIVFTANASHLVSMRHDVALREACLASDLVTADGMSVVWAAGLLGRALPERVTGIDLMQALLRAGSDVGLRVFFLGARREVLDRLIVRCRRAHPGLVIAGARDGYFGPTQHDEVVGEIRESQADILFVGMPSPFKEVWCHRHRDSFGVRLIIGVGGSFDVLAGFVPRAPRWMQRAGLEWCWRLMNEPRKLWKRYLVGNSTFAWLVLKELVAQRWPRLPAWRAPWCAMLAAVLPPLT